MTTHDNDAMTQYFRGGPTSFWKPGMWKPEALGFARTVRTNPSNPTLKAAVKDLHVSPTVHHLGVENFLGRNKAIARLETRSTKLACTPT